MPEWLCTARGSFSELINQYRLKSASQASHSPEAKRRRITDVSLIDSDESDDDELSDIDQQLVEYKRDSSHKQLKMDKTTSPIDYWMGKTFTWPQLAGLALNVFAIPVMSDEPERVFSTTGHALSPRRRRLKDETIDHLMSVKAWSKAGLVKIDRYIHCEALLALSDIIQVLFQHQLAPSEADIDVCRAYYD